MLEKVLASVRRALRPMVALTAAVGIAAFGAGCTRQPAGSGSGSASQAAEKPEQTAEAVAAGLYREVVADPALHFEGRGLDEGFVQNGEYTYALAEVNELDAPVLLLCLHGDPATWNGVDAVVMLYVDADGQLATCGDELSRGVAGAGGYRGEIYASAYGDGLICNEVVSSGSGEMVVRRLAFDGQDWTDRQIHHGELGQDVVSLAPVAEEQRELVWNAVDDTAALDELETGEWESAVDPSAAPAASVAEEVGLQVYTGTVRVLDGDALSELQGVENTSSGSPYDPESYAVLILDEPVEVDAINGDGMGRRTEETTIIRFAVDDDAWSAYDGQTVTMAVDPDSIWWPSDVSLPVGGPRTETATVIGA